MIIAKAISTIFIVFSEVLTFVTWALVLSVGVKYATTVPARYPTFRLCMNDSFIYLFETNMHITDKTRFVYSKTLFFIC